MEIDVSNQIQRKKGSIHGFMKEEKGNPEGTRQARHLMLYDGA